MYAPRADEGPGGRKESPFMTAAGKLWTQELLVHSPVIFERPLEHLKVGELRRNILLFPMGNSNGQANDMVSVYLNYGDQKVFAVAKKV
jgi:hypothetical protein